MSANGPNYTSNVDAANQRAMRQQEAISHYAVSDYLDAGEKALYDRIANEVAGKPILDIGVGAGRTVKALTAISSDYTAIDYTQGMVEATKRRFPGVKVLWGDARDMSMFGDRSFHLAVFSCAGLDMVGAEDRLRILREVRRVLVPGGAFVFSTHNFEPRKYKPEPSLLEVLFPIEMTKHPVRLARRVASALPHAYTRLKNYRALRPLAEHHDDWAILNSKYHQYNTLMLYITLAAQRAQLEACGFEPGAVAYSDEGELLTGSSSQTFMLHVMARTPKASTA